MRASLRFRFATRVLEWLVPVRVPHLAGTRSRGAIRSISELSRRCPAGMARAGIQAGDVDFPRARGSRPIPAAFSSSTASSPSAVFTFGRVHWTRAWWAAAGIRGGQRPGGWPTNRAAARRDSALEIRRPAGFLVALWGIQSSEFRFRGTPAAFPSSRRPRDSRHDGRRSRLFRKELLKLRLKILTMATSTRRR